MIAAISEGIQVITAVRNVSFARLGVASGGESTKVGLGLNCRKNEPVRLAVGPVLHADDAVANKVCALFGRAEVRDYVDVAAILASGRYTEEGLLNLAAEDVSALKARMRRWAGRIRDAPVE